VHRGRVLGLAEQLVVSGRVPVDSRQEQPAYGEGGGVDGHRELVVTVFAEQRGGEGDERHDHKEQEVEVEENPVVGPYGAEDAVVDHPEGADSHEAQEIAQVFGPEGKQRGG
jgi:hypothetical protein